MPLKLPVQYANDPHEGYPVPLVVFTAVPEEGIVLADELGGNYGNLPADPPPLRCDRSTPGCAMPGPCPVPMPFGLPAPVLLVGPFGI